jgi:hypothetical protein
MDTCSQQKDPKRRLYASPSVGKKKKRSTAGVEAGEV